MVERFASEQGGSLHTVGPDCRAVCEQFVRAHDYDVMVADRDQISLTLAVAKADRDKWFNRAREMEAELATWRQIGTSNAARIEGLEAALRACTEKGANIHVIARDALTAPETGAKYGDVEVYDPVMKIWVPKET